MTLKENIITGLSYLRQPKKRKLIRFSRQFKSLTGLEIGGPSSFFSLRSYLPIYLFAKNIDGVNFSTNTMWEGKIAEGKTFSYYNNHKGYQYISEAGDLSKIENEVYDFIASCHCLEHVANPIKALKEWNRVLKPGGLFVLVLPDKNYTFDEARPITTFRHLQEDFENQIDETDSTHFNEVINLHNIEKDNGTQTRDQLIERTNNNSIIRGIHHHVFNFELIAEMLAYTKFSVILQEWVSPFHLVTLAKKIS